MKKKLGLLKNIGAFFFLGMLGLSGWLMAYHYYRAGSVVPLISNEVLAEQTLAQTTVNAQWYETTIKHGDTIEKIFKRFHLSYETLEDILHLEGSKKILLKIKPGEKIRLLISSDQELEKIEIPLNEKQHIIIAKNEGGFSFENQAVSENPIKNPIKERNHFIYKYGSAIVQKSLFETGLQAGLSHKQAMQLITLFSQNQLIRQSVHRGDRLEVLYLPNEHYINFAQMTHRNKIYQIYRYTDPNGNSDYYTEDGFSLRPSLVRAPLNYDHISSRFSTHRWNPILHFVRPHYGVDYAASMGTPVKAAGDGHISFLGYRGGYGKAVIIDHLASYATLYGHLSRFAKGVHPGSLVKQGQIIGYVGDTGESTGSHLHFEIRVNNIPRNPLSVALPKGIPVPNRYRTGFFAIKRQLLAEYHAMSNHG